MPLPPLTAFKAVASHQPQTKAVIDFDSLPDSAMLRLADFASARGKPGIVPASGSTIWRWIKNDQFPAPIKISSGITAWTVQSLREWLTQQTRQ